MAALVVVRGGRAIPSVVSAEDEAELVRGRTQTFRFELLMQPTHSLAAIILEARAELASRNLQHAEARRFRELAALVGNDDEERFKVLATLDCVVVDTLEASRLKYERAEWLRNGGRT